MDLHPYDGKERRYRHTDSDMAPGIRIVMGLLPLPAPPSASGLMYDLSVYSGGIGILDRLAITLPRNDTSAPIVLARLQCKSPEEITSERWEAGEEPVGAEIMRSTSANGVVGEREGP